MTLLLYWQECNNKSSLPTHKLAYMTSRLQAKEPRGATIQKTTIRTYPPKQITCIDVCSFIVANDFLQISTVAKIICRGVGLK